MSPKNTFRSSSSRSDRKHFDLLPDLEDLGEVLNTCKKSDAGESQQKQEKDCQTCTLKDTCETAVQARSELIAQRGSISEGKMPHNNDQEMTKPIRKPLQHQPQVRQKVSKQDPKRAVVPKARSSSQGMSTTAAEKTRSLDNTEGSLNSADAEPVN